MTEFTHLKNRRILVIDDNRAIHDDFRKILSPGLGAAPALEAVETELFGKPVDQVRQIRYEIDSAYQGQDGMLLVKKALEAGRPYALAFVDIRMPPGMDGVETTRKIWEIDPEIQIVLCTAYADYSWDEMFEKIGNSDGLVILKKPFDTVEALQLAQALTEKWWLHQQSRKKMEELERMVTARTAELASSLSLLNATLESAADGIVVVDLSGKVISYNTKFAAIWQYPADMLARRDAAELRACAARQVKDPAAFKERLKESQANPEAELFDVIELKDGRTFERYISPQRINGKCVGTVINWRDITQRRRAEESLRESEERFAGAFEFAPIGMALVSRGGRFLKVNRELCGLTGYAEAELLNRTFQDITHPEDLARDLESLRQMLAGEIRSYQMEKRYIHAQGHSVAVLLNVSLVRDGQGQPRYFISQIQDITGRKRAETVLLESKRFLRSTLDALSSHIAILDEHGTIIEVNAAWNRFAAENDFMHGLRGVGDNYLEVCDSAAGNFSEEAPKVASGLRAIMAAQRAEFQLEYPCHGPKEKRWFIVRATRFSGDGPVRVVVAHENISERKLAENALRESNEKFHQLADNITDVFWIRSPDLSEVQYLSPAFERIWGRSVESLQTNPQQWADFILPEDRERVLEEFAALTGEKRSLDIEYRIMRPDGEIRWVHVRGFQVRDAADDLIRHIGIVTDITERKQVENLARQSQERYRSLVDNARDAIFTIARDGTFTSLNPAAEVIGGLSRAEWIGKSFTQMVHPDDLPLAQEMFHRILRGEQAPVHELRGNPGLIRPATMEMTLAAQKNESGEIIGVMGIGRDITERKLLEVRLFQSQKLETVGKLAGGVAHEFNSILTAIIGQSELLREDLPAGSPLIASANEISQAAGRAAVLTRQLLAYGRKQFLRPEALDLNQVIASMDGVLRHLMGGEMVAVEIVPGTGPQLVTADAGQLEQVIMNMAMNARDAMPNGGKLMLETDRVTFDLESVGRYPELKPGDYVILAISDTGIGMSEEIKAHAFEPFFTTKGVGQGTGLGLSTCYGIIKQSGGHISVYSELGRGTIFKIYLPQVESPMKIPLERLDSPGLPRGTETILLVEDDPALREMAATLLKRLGYTVWAAANGVEALSLSHERGTGRIDLLFTDVVMPHMSGKELADRVRVLYPHTRILFTSAYTENAIVHQGVLNKGVALLQKPFTPSALARKLRDMLDQPESLQSQ